MSTSSRTNAAHTRARAAIAAIVRDGGIPTVSMVMTAASCRRGIAAEECAVWRASAGAQTAIVHPPAMSALRNAIGLVADMSNVLKAIDAANDESDLADRFRRICYARGIAQPNRKRKTIGSRATRRGTERPTRRDSHSESRASRLGRSTRTAVVAAVMDRIDCA